MGNITDDIRQHFDTFAELLGGFGIEFVHVCAHA